MYVLIFVLLLLTSFTAPHLSLNARALAIRLAADATYMRLCRHRRLARSDAGPVLDSMYPTHAFEAGKGRYPDLLHSCCQSQHHFGRASAESRPHLAPSAVVAHKSCIWHVAGQPKSFAVVRRICVKYSTTSSMFILLMFQQRAIPAFPESNVPVERARCCSAHVAAAVS